MVESVTGLNMTNFKKSDEGDSKITINNMKLNKIFFNHKNNHVIYKENMFYLNFTQVNLNITTNYTLDALYRDNEHCKKHDDRDDNNSNNDDNK